MTGKKRKGNEIADTKGFDQEQTKSFGDGKGSLQKVLSLVV